MQPLRKVHQSLLLLQAARTMPTGRSFSVRANLYLAALQIKLNYALSTLQAKSKGHPPVVVLTGYYNPVSNECIGQQNIIAPEEIAWLNGERDALNQTIRSVVSRYSFARYTSTDFTDHGICAADPWVQGLNDPAPFHPNKQGQSAIARSVLQALGS
jgi:lysophospholipase L1-like esterase